MLKSNLIYVGYSNIQAGNVCGNMNQKILVKNTVFVLVKSNTKCGFRNNTISDFRIRAWIRAVKDFNPLIIPGSTEIPLKEKKEFLWV
jgi:hypothetical protein